ncbi:rifin, partial [Plasmodium reichenowi]
RSLGGDTCQRIGTNLGIFLKDGKYGAPGTTPIETVLNEINRKATLSADHVTKTTSQSVTAAIKTEKTGVINTVYGSWETTIIASIVVIVVIVLIMVIIYLILRYRRKKKMKKKLQYIKLLEE